LPPLNLLQPVGDWHNPFSIIAVKYSLKKIGTNEVGLEFQFLPLYDQIHLHRKNPSAF